MNNSKKTWLYGSIYFAALAAVNLLVGLFSGVSNTLDVVLLVLGTLPLLFRRKIFLILYGFSGAFVCLYMGIACLFSQAGPQSDGTVYAYLLGYALSVSGILAALSLVYSGLQHSEKNTFSLI